MGKHRKPPSQGEAALYGKAMAAAQWLEDELAQVVAVYETESSNKSGPTMGRLLTMLRKRVPLRRDLETDLANALAIRNRLAHTYFREAHSLSRGARNSSTLQTSTEIFVRLSAEVARIHAAYGHTNSKGQDYYLHARDVTLKGGRVQRIWFFTSKRGRGMVVEMPTEWTVVENARTGLLLLKKA